MTAAGKITTARIAEGDRVLVKHYTRDNMADLTTLDYLNKDWALGISTTKTGQGVEVARVLKVEAAAVTGGRRDKRVYDVYTTAGVISNCAPSQTWTLAPEDAAGIKRAHVEAMALNEVMDAYPVAEDEAPAQEPTLDTLARVAQSLGRTLRPVLEAGVVMARTIPDGRRRHGQIKARRDALRHARKLELAGI